MVLGDARYFVLVERVRAGTLTARAWQLALAFSLLVPIASYLPQRAFPSAFSDLRLTFLTYEGMFLVLALGLRAWLPRRLASARAADRSWALRATEFEIVQYGLWVLADVLILRGHDVGFLVRFVPNTMYYVLFLPFAAWSAPQNQKGSWRAAHA